MANALTGEVTERPHRYEEVGSGLNGLNAAGEWVAPQDLIEPTADGELRAERGDVCAGGRFGFLDFPTARVSLS